MMYFGLFSLKKRGEKGEKEIAIERGEIEKRREDTLREALDQ